MAVKTLMDVEEYLRTSFDGADCEYLEGVVLERNMGELPHASVQMLLGNRLLALASQLRIRERIPTVAPFLAIEILSSSCCRTLPAS